MDKMPLFHALGNILNEMPLFRGGIFSKSKSQLTICSWREIRPCLFIYSDGKQEGFGGFSKSHGKRAGIVSGHFNRLIHRKKMKPLVSDWALVNPLQSLCIQLDLRSILIQFSRKAL